MSDKSGGKVRIKWLLQWKITVSSCFVSLCMAIIWQFEGWMNTKRCPSLFFTPTGTLSLAPYIGTAWPVLCSQPLSCFWSFTIKFSRARSCIYLDLCVTGLKCESEYQKHRQTDHCLSGCGSLFFPCGPLALTPRCNPLRHFCWTHPPLKPQALCLHGDVLNEILGQEIFSFTLFLIFFEGELAEHDGNCCS